MKNNDKDIITGTIIDETTVFTLDEVKDHLQIEDAFLSELVEYGLISFNKSTHGNLINGHSLHLIHAAHRLHHDLELNASGVVLVLELLDEMNKLRSELIIYKKIHG